MARTISAGALTTLLAAEHWHWLRITIENPDGALIDVRNLQGVDWQDEATVNEDVDHAIMSGVFRLRLDTDSVSMSPLMGGSLVNRDALAAYVPFLQANRDVIAYVAVVDVGVTPIEADWKKSFVGVIDRVKFGDESTSFVTLECRDLGARILDRWLVRKKTYSDGDGMLLSDLLFANNGILRDAFGSPPTYTDYLGTPLRIRPAVDYYVPVDPGALVFQYEQEPGPTLDVMRERALQIGWELRFRFDAADAFRLTLYEPPRGNAVADWTLTPSQYEKITQLDIGIEHVRNWVEVEYRDRASGERRRVESINKPSIGKYGTRWMEIVLADDDVIDSDAEAQDLADAAANDLGEPWADHELEMDLFWPVQLGDVIQLNANLVHYDSAQKMAVVAINHTLKGGQGVTKLLLRGTVTGAWKEWIRRQAQSTDIPEAVLRITNFREVARDPTHVTLGWDVEGVASELWLNMLEYEANAVGADPWPTLDTPSPIRLTPDTRQYTITLPRLGRIKYGMLIPLSAEMAPGIARDFTVQPNDTLPFLSAFKQVAGADGLHRDLAFLVTDPAGLGGTLRAWTNHASSSDADADGAIEGTLAIVATPYVADATKDFALTVGGISKLLDEIRVHPGKGKRIFFEFINSDSVSSGVIHTLLTPGTAPVDDSNELIAAIIHDYTPFASSVRPYRILGALPGSGLFVGEMILLTTDNKLYRWTGSAWTTAIATVDLSGQINTAQIADAAIIAQKIGDAAVITAKLALAAVTADIIAANAVTETKITDTAVTTPKLVAAAVTTGKIAAGAVTSNEIAANTIVAGNIAAGTITGAKIAANTITAGNIAALTITAAEIAALTITGAKIAAGTITADKILANSLGAGQITAGSITATEIASNAITAVKIAASAVTAAKISISTLASIATDAGIIVAGKLQNAGGTQYLDLNATGTNGFLVHDKLVLRANGNAEFSGDVVLSYGSSSIYWKNSGSLYAQISTFALSGGPPGFTYSGIELAAHGVSSGSASLYWYYYQESSKGVLHVDGDLEVTLNLAVTGDITCDDVTCDFISANSISMGDFFASTFNGAALSVGAADTGGLGYRALVVPN